MSSAFPLRSSNRQPIAWIATLAVIFSQAPVSAQIRDHSLTWRTIDTPHFHVHYHEPLALVARRVGAALEQAHSHLREVFGFEPPQMVEVMVTDDSDSANGSAIAVPYSIIRVYAEPPDDLSPLQEYDDWITALVSHEHTHILHLDQASGFPSLVNALLGKVYMPNHLSPRWLLEGVAVWQETEVTSAGRLRSTMWDMFLRADTLASRTYSIDQLTHGADRWPHGNSAYLYGSFFVDYIARHYGREALARMIRDYGSSVVPYGLNRVAERATGHSFVDLYHAFLTERRESDRARVAALGVLYEGTALTHHGENARAPRFWGNTLVYMRGDNRSRGRLLEIDSATGEERALLARLNGGGEATRAASGDIYFSRVDAHRDAYMYSDLFRRDVHGDVQRLTHGARAREPDVSPDGTRILFTTSRAGSTHLLIAETRDVERTMHELAIQPRFQQVYTPRWSPDGTRICASFWRQGGRRDIALVSPENGDVEWLTDDRAVDTGPVFSPDGAFLYFSSDRTGIANIYRMELATHTLEQVTNVALGAYTPAIDATSQTLVYVGYSTFGFDLMRMPLAPELFTPALPSQVERSSQADSEPLFHAISHDYDPLPTLYPRNYLIDASPDTFGQALGITVGGTDAAEFHSYRARVGVGLVRGNVSADLNYAYQRSVVRMEGTLFRRVTQQYGFVAGGENLPWVQEAYGGTLAAAYVWPGSFSQEALSLSYAGTFTRSEEELAINWDPNTPPPRFPRTGYFSTVRLAYSYSDVERYAYDISPHNGKRLAFGGAISHPYLGSRNETYSLTWSYTQYLPMPWSDQHILAFRYGGGLSAGRDNATFAVGGYPQLAMVEGLLDGSVTSGIALRGYPVNDRVGNQFHLAQLEYRFPIYRFNAGPFTLPVYLNRLYGVVHGDVGDAFSSSFDIATFRVAAGASLQLDFTLFYYLAFTLRVGYARGFMARGTDQVFVNLGTPF